MGWEQFGGTSMELENIIGLETYVRDRPPRTYKGFDIYNDGNEKAMKGINKWSDLLFFFFFFSGHFGCIMHSHMRISCVVDFSQIYLG